MDIKPCYICGELPTIKRISSRWYNAEHHECDGEPGVSIANCSSADRAIDRWNSFQRKIETGKVALLRVSHLTQRAPDLSKAARICQPLYVQLELGLPAMSG